MARRPKFTMNPTPKCLLFPHKVKGDNPGWIWLLL